MDKHAPISRRPVRPPAGAGPASRPPPTPKPRPTLVSTPPPLPSEPLERFGAGTIIDARWGKLL